MNACSGCCTYAARSGAWRDKTVDCLMVSPLDVVSTTAPWCSLAMPSRERQTGQSAGCFGHFNMPHRITLLAIDGCFASNIVGAIDMFFAANLAAAASNPPAEPIFE